MVFDATPPEEMTCEAPEETVVFTAFPPEDMYCLLPEYRIKLLATQFM